MNESNLVMAILTIREQVGFLWNFYVTACVFLIGWIFSSKTIWTETKRKVIIGLFGAFALVNLSAIYNEYELLASATNQLYAMASSENRFLAKLSNGAGIGSLLASVIHLTADAFIIYLINFRCRGVENA
ncbi:hypothetical protein [Alteromonas sp. KUL49]|uniref:hypothetical protein n=1 Tax=Alteromonas sp. KUL49 TaxID=2480798 RepID=UPI00102F0E54|nr:hypothetical protein [Alteromonas sp. KUL49]TAP41304.1 hypothetical protein EYS00_03680 [Alteromonas sp. KUL49]GEA10364.1 hypothetical protein KUL49_07390 [Alteromonas sp. KUL49]